MLVVQILSNDSSILARSVAHDIQHGILPSWMTPLHTKVGQYTVPLRASSIRILLDDKVESDRGKPSRTPEGLRETCIGRAVFGIDY